MTAKCICYGSGPHSQTALEKEAHAKGFGVGPDATFIAFRQGEKVDCPAGHRKRNGWLHFPPDHFFGRDDWRFTSDTTLRSDS
jgi:hypothetical protein